MRLPVITLGFFALTTLSTPVGANTGTSVLFPKTTLSNEQKAFHLFNRLGYGPRPGEVEQLAKGGENALVEWLQHQTHPLPLAASSPLGLKLARLKTLAASPEVLLEQYQPLAKVARQQGLEKTDQAAKKDLRAEIGKEHLPNHIEQELAAQKLLRAVESDNQLEEVLTDFWFNHFNIDWSKNEDKWLLTSYERDVIRPNVFGKFRDFLGAVAHSPAMLIYLDNWLSVRDGFTPPAKFKQVAAGKPGNRTGINENYARELLELHTLGVDGGYSQNDVREVARALTGWTVERPKKDPRFIFRQRQHDTDEKRVLGSIIPAGGGQDDGERVLDIVSRHPATAKFIATKLCRRFVSDRPAPGLIARIAKTFQASGGDLRATYLAIFTSPEFWSKDSVRAKIKTPLEFVVSGMRAVDAHIDADYSVPLRFIGRLDQMGMAVYRCPPPTGYKDSADAWVSPGALVARINFGVALSRGNVKDVTPQLKSLGTDKMGENPGDLMRDLGKRLLHGELRDSTRDAIMHEVSHDRQTLPEDHERVKLNVVRVTGLILGSPEFQRR